MEMKAQSRLQAAFQGEFSRLVKSGFVNSNHRDDVEVPFGSRHEGFIPERHEHSRSLVEKFQGYNVQRKPVDKPKTLLPVFSDSV